MSAFVEVISPGAYSSIQDRGRRGFRKYGVPISGAMDQNSADLANHLLNNAPDDPVLEITLSGPKLLFSSSSCITLTGADLSPRINGKEVVNNKVLTIEKGDVLSFGALRNGTRCYLAIKGGFKTAFVMNSYSYYLPVTRQQIINKGDRLPFDTFKPLAASNASIKPDTSIFSSIHLECAPGPEFELIDSNQKQLIFETHFSIGRDNNRMGYRLEGDSIISPQNYSMLTSAVLPGTVQLTPSGQLIVLMKDCQTTGGYPRILQLTQRGINLLAQKKAPDTISFKSI